MQSVLHLILVLQIVICCIGRAASDCSDLDEDQNGHNIRLPNNSKPVSYDLIISIDEIDRTFDGAVSIRIAVVNTTKVITLHSAYLNIRKVSAYSFSSDEDGIDSAKEISNIRYGFDQDYYEQSNFMFVYSANNEFEFKENHTYLLDISYNGAIGLSRAIFGIELVQDRRELTMIATHFQPVFTREAFPCYDEPHLKARFRLTLIHSHSYSSLSNMPLDGKPTAFTPDKKPTPNRLISKFHQTPPMSCYLLAFVLHNRKKFSLSRNNVTHSIYYENANQKKNAEYTARKSIELLNAMENYFRLPYPLPKLDHIAVPSFYSMENWALIFYANEMFLLPSKCDKTDADHKIIITFAHEMVHQWFGNLVTPTWWSYTWLSEGFAIHYSYYFAKQIFPECISDEDYFDNSIRFAFRYCKRPLSVNLTDKAQLIKVFDDVSYHKGAAIVRMLIDCLTEATFKKGLYYFLTKFKFDSVTEDDLFESLQRAAIEDKQKYFNQNGFVSEFIKTWTGNRGYPMLAVQRLYASNQLIITQMPNIRNYNAKWYIPIQLTTTKSKQDVFKSKTQNTIDFIMPPIQNVTLDLNIFNATQNLTKDDWLIVNNKVSSLVYVTYDTNNLYLLRRALKSKQIFKAKL